MHFEEGGALGVAGEHTLQDGAVIAHHLLLHVQYLQAQHVPSGVNCHMHHLSADHWCHTFQLMHAVPATCRAL